PIRIAILDTGCDLTLKSFQEAKCFKGWRDFAAQLPSKIEVDEYRHGTFMARLVMLVVPGCKLYIARITQTRQQLERNKEGVAKVSNLHSIHIPLNIISISFGFPKFSRPISNAIHNVKKARKGAIILLASAGNDVNRAKAYPACNPSVISIYAAKSTGAFLRTNPIPSEESRRLLGTYGDNVSDIVLKGLRSRFVKRDFSPGTSVATAVAAGVVGQILAYAALLPHILRGCGAKGVSSDLKTTDGMRCMLFSMARSGNRVQYFINPILFWSYKSDESSMYWGMCRALS
ncbi:peptidase S8/S53 domain-containing protein, partial [Diaporthe sp. PMI_573]